MTSPTRKGQLVDRRSTVALTVWIADAHTTWVSTERLLHVLTPAERELSRHRARPDLRAAFVRSRALRRAALAEATSKPADALVFLHGAKGKPYLADGPGFSVSNSGGLVAIAVASNDCAVGLDVEIERDIPDLSLVAERFLPATERATLDALPQSEQRSAFLFFWTRFEAFVKATGEGLTLRRERLPSLGSDCSTIVSVDGQGGTTVSYSLRSFRPCPETMAAICVANDFTFAIERVPTKLGGVQMLQGGSGRHDRTTPLTGGLEACQGGAGP